MKKQRFISIVAILLMAVALVSANGMAEDKPAAFFSTTDSTGTLTVLQSCPQRIVSLSPNITETLFALSKGDSVVGRTDYCNYPSEAAAVPSVGDLYDVNIEKVVATEPDAVLCSPLISKETVRSLRGLGLNVIVIDMQETLDGTYAMIEEIGQIAGARDQSKDLIESMKERISAVEARIEGSAKVSCYYCVGYGEYGDFTATGDTYIDEIIKAAGGDNIASDGTYWTYSREQLLAKDPEVIVFPAYSYSNFDLDRQYFETTEPYSALSAVKNKKLLTVNGDVMDRQGPRTAEAVENLAAVLHPELF
ncbi:MAG: ABC transporter substrate-binding protein [Sphaerochaetaceae bacterium]|nr:ABC transporter substrate-binding protein [Sphaerochaetaceae bacterium]MDD3163006.1 ABC transporter substrate-binding protein [Sphaerochaetaceae bacterium]MDD4007266.1 ABC transporter substrate-binding protein [Sphaerochaetaceae bacterium]MDD4396202.1 ABC transporter substrate-binding protein [Sphaerochaetaceae bacterium]